MGLIFVPFRDGIVLTRFRRDSPDTIKSVTFGDKRAILRGEFLQTIYVTKLFKSFNYL